ncbi:MAG: hypothetical protein CM15mP77_3220 [Synechococcus sp.]|nr:MAG: hypothetical protein CM15mP77_3220 [Synechococcus sp.]
MVIKGVGRSRLAADHGLNHGKHGAAMLRRQYRVRPDRMVSRTEGAPLVRRGGDSFCRNELGLKPWLEHAQACLFITKSDDSVTDHPHAAGLPDGPARVRSVGWSIPLRWERIPSIFEMAASIC